MKTAIVIGAGGATAAKELQGKFQVTILEAGQSFHPFAEDLKLIEKTRRTGLLFNEKQVRWIFPPMNIGRTPDKIVLVNGVGYGGTTTLSAGNAVRQDQDFKTLGIDLGPEFQELSLEIQVSADHRRNWHPLTRQTYSICQDLGLNPVPTPKMIRLDRCKGCGHCILGCPSGAKWDSREFLKQAVDKGARLFSGCRVKKLVIENGYATGVIAARGWHTRFYPADLVIVAAGGLGTPLVLERSGIPCRPDLFVDPVLCVASRCDGAQQNREMPMPFIVQKERFIISPYFDFLSFFFNRDWHYPAGDIFSLMIKLADTNTGSISIRGVRKTLTEVDKTRLKEGVGYCKEIFYKLGKKDEDIFLGTINAGHPGGMLPLTVQDSRTLHPRCLPANVYVSDASLFPNSLGNPPILTIAALAKRISKLC